MAKTGECSLSDTLVCVLVSFLCIFLSSEIQLSFRTGIGEKGVILEMMGWVVVQKCRM